VLHPAVLSTLRKAKGTTNDAYTFDPLSAAPTAVHGTALVPSAAVDAAEVWVVSRQSSTIYRRGALGVEFRLSDTDFTDNTISMRSEERLVCAVRRPGLITQITIDNG
jgi:hypothetical protein